MLRRLPTLLLAAAACSVPAAAGEPDSLRAAFAGRFDIGTAISARQLLPPRRDVLDLVAEQFSVVTPENLMKWQHIHPEPGVYDFEGPDALVAFAEENGLRVIGHTLVWHSQTPRWVFRDDSGEPLTRAALVERMRDHIHTVVGRYRGRIHGWDVVNEAVLDNGDWRDTPWRRIIGEDYLELAFRFAREADPEVELYYNDFSMTKRGKRETVCRMVRDFQERGVPIDGVGMQAHWGMDYPLDEEIEASLAAFGDLGVHLMITELDVNLLPRPGGGQGADVSERADRRDELDPYRDGLPYEVGLRLAERYAHFFRFFLKHDPAITRVTFWGVDDGQTWLNNWPIRGRNAHALPFDKNLRPKAAYQAILETAE